MNPVRETKAKKKKLEAEIRKLLAASRDGTLSRKKLESGLSKLKSVTFTMPDHDDQVGGPRG
jgi:hypothetical protein